MSIGINLTYQGVVSARYAEGNMKTNNSLLAGQTISGELNGEAFSLTISDEYIELNNSMEQFLLNDYNVKKADPNDVFSYRPRDQWLVFSQYLHDKGGFEGMTNQEAYELENILKQITDGLDSLTSTGISFSGTNKQLTSHEARLELIASTKALELFSEKYLTDDLKEGFDSLIEDYVEHNEKKVRGHLSIEEKFYQARSKLSATNVSLPATQRRELDITNTMALAQLEEGSLDKLLNTYRDLLVEVKDQSDLLISIEKMKEKAIESVVERVNRPYQEAVTERVDALLSDTLNRITNYFALLL
ncbi:hypothetical protein [Alkaliphilus transvaalensis]|uniref:hypothetical protein n=1 Tax=Alkaliphilus transvaalensis TaxID=114628 RepID=UPI000687C54F|nr:hypothetical protein [Alkaliphilus transvaalensis]